MDWLKLESEEDLEEAIKLSSNDNLGVAIFKHSKRCSISSVAKTRLSSSWDFNENIPIYLLDLIAFRDISRLISEKFNVEHESPQLLIINKGVCIYHASHLSIAVKSIRTEIQS